MTDIQPQEAPAEPSLDNLIRDYVSKRLRYEYFNWRMEQAKAEMKNSMFVLWDEMGDQEMKTIHHSLGRITRSTTTIALVRDLDSLMGELDDLGLRGAFTKIAIEQAKLNALLRERLDAGEDVPAGTAPHVQKRISFARTELTKQQGARIAAHLDGEQNDDGTGDE